MGIEIERKFLVKNDAWRDGVGKLLCQGYLSLDPDRTIRVRIADDEAWLTIKGRAVGTRRVEYEYAIPLDDARELLQMTAGSPVEKRRYCIPHAGFVWEVDEFLGENAGLVVAEIELPSEDAQFDLPAWVGPEVTHEARYLNANLVQFPYSRWSIELRDGSAGH
ncbi:MAG: CYTH domain-containing protein [Planctomycetales bacterium]|nr:CYTH domain-containing protein [Planctomycetales bacterium]